MTAKFISLGGDILGCLLVRSVPDLQEIAKGIDLTITRDQAIEAWKRAADALQQDLEEEITFAMEALGLAD